MTTTAQKDNLLTEIRANIIGQDQTFETPYGTQQLVYADWTASGRLYAPIESKLTHLFGPFVANTHTETNMTGSAMTLAYEEARNIIKRHVNASPNDCLIAYGSGMTGAVNKFQRILNLRLPESWQQKLSIAPQERPVIFVSHMEHHSNQTSWLETIGEVVVIDHTEDGLVNLDHLAFLLEKFIDRPRKIAAITACSNVTGIETPYHQVAAMMHQYGGLCFVDFACSAPYVSINMHPENPDERLDAIYFSPHKFLGGPGAAGILIFNSELYRNSVPDNPGGGTVKWTNPWNEHDYVDDVEQREDGGTPPFLQTIRAALCIQLKDKIGVDRIRAREHEMVDLIFDRLQPIPGLTILAGQHRERLSVFSFNIEGLHYNLGVKLLNDRFGIQVRGGCSCAGTYGHYLLEVSRDSSLEVTRQISQGNLAVRPGWIRMSVHPVMTNEEIDFICRAIAELAQHHEVWANDYCYQPATNSYTHKKYVETTHSMVAHWFG
jgi:selenocysteine lyase/cysteine desulfurase